MITVPVDTPHTTPPETVATAELLLLQAPPAAASVRVVHVPTQMLVPPVIGPIGLTVTAFVAIQVPME